MIDKAKAAKQAVSELDDRTEGTIDASKVGAGKDYADQAVKTLRRQSGGYDPDTLAEPLAHSAVVEFVKARIIGREPQNTQDFVRAADRWSRTAAAEYHTQGHNL